MSEYRSRLRAALWLTALVWLLATLVALWCEREDDRLTDAAPGVYVVVR